MIFKFIILITHQRRYPDIAAMSQYNFQQKIQKLYEYREKICSNPIRNILTLLVVTIIPVFVPMLYFSITNLDLFVSQLPSSCVQLNALNPNSNNNNQYAEELCLSCYYRQEAEVPNQFKIGIKQTNNSIYTGYPENHQKKIITISSDTLLLNPQSTSPSSSPSQQSLSYISLSEMLSCKDLVHMLDYEKIIKNKELAVNQRLSEVQFERQVKSVQNLVKLLDISMSEQMGQSSMLMQQNIGVFGILQIVRNQAQQKNMNLIQVYFPKIQIIQSTISFLFIFVYLAIMTCIAIMIYRFTKTSVLHYQLFGNLTILFGLLASLYYNKLNSNNFFYFTTMILYACLTFLKVQVSKLNITLFGIFTTVIYMLASASSPQLLVPIKIIICLSTIVIVFLNTYQSFENRPFFIYLWAVWNILTFLEVKYEIYDDHRSIFCIYILIVVSVVLMEVINKQRLIIFGEEITEDSKGNFTKITNLQEQDQDQFQIRIRK